MITLLFYFCPTFDNRRNNKKLNLRVFFHIKMNCIHSQQLQALLLT